MTAKAIPPATHLQFLILDIIGESKERPGLAIRQCLIEYDEERNGPAFYQLMRRLEDYAWVKGEYASTVQSATANRRGQHLREKTYRLTALGKKVHNQTLQFYQEKRNIN